MDEQQAIRELKAGEIGGLEYFVRRFQVKALRVAFLISGDSALAEDIVQDAFVNAYGAMHGFDASRPFEPWFMRSVVNAAVKASRRSAREVPLDDRAAESLIMEVLSTAPSMESQVESLDLEAQISTALQQLSARQRAVVIQRYYLGMSESEMAFESGTSRGTVKWLLNAARERLRSLLAERHDQ